MVDLARTHTLGCSQKQKEHDKEPEHVVFSNNSAKKSNKVVRSGAVFD